MFLKLVGCLPRTYGAEEVRRADVDIQGQGGSAGELIYNAWATDYLFNKDNVYLSYNYVNDSTQAVMAFKENSEDALFVSLESKLLAELHDDGIYQLPILATALTVCFNLPELNSTDILIFEGNTLVDIWLGNITKWNDPILRANNPDISDKLPDLDIKLVLDVTPMSRTEVLFNALANYSSRFGNVWDANSRPYSSLPAVAQGRAMVYHDRASVMSFLSTTHGAMTQISYDQALQRGFRYAHLRNSAGKIVSFVTNG